MLCPWWVQHPAPLGQSCNPEAKPGRSTSHAVGMLRHGCDLLQGLGVLKDGDCSPAVFLDMQPVPAVGLRMMKWLNLQ